MSKTLVTGTAGFIGSAVVLELLDRGHEVIGIDNHNDYYSQALKQDRLERHLDHPGYTHVRADIADRVLIRQLFEQHRPTRVINLAAQAGVRYSLLNPDAYIDSNLVGFANILEGCRHGEVEHLLYASSSSVYGSNESIPFSVHDNVDHPLSLYAATKKANELMAHTYSHLYQLPTTGLRFFTVYGPWGRPDMSPYLFADAIVSGQPIQVFNYGKHKRDFTYIDDIVQGVVGCLEVIPAADSNWSGKTPDPASSHAPWKVYNLGNSRPVDLLDYIQLMEKALGRQTEKELLPLQPGDVEDTYADISELARDTGYAPRYSIEQGLAKYAEWFLDYYGH